MGIYLVKIKHQIQLAHISKKTIQHLHEKVYSFQVSKFIVVRIHTDAEEQSCVAPVDDLQGTELDKVGLVLLVTRGDQTMYFTFEADFIVILKL